MGTTVTLLLAGALLGTEGTWQQVDQEDGITVWVRDVADSGVREVKAAAMFAVPATRVWAVLVDSSKFIEFMPYVVENRVVAKHPTGHYEYQRIDPPLVAMRDYTMKVVFEADEARGVYRRSWKAARDLVPKRDDCVRLEVNEGAWTVTATGPNEARVEYRLHTDPGGSIPGWVANRANRTSVPKLLHNLRERSLDPTWKRDE